VANLDEPERTLEWLEEKLNLDGAGIAKLARADSCFLGLGLKIQKERVAWNSRRSVWKQPCRPEIQEQHSRMKVKGESKPHSERWE
jgi:hypothetical protein